MLGRISCIIRIITMFTLIVFHSGLSFKRLFVCIYNIYMLHIYTYMVIFLTKYLVIYCVKMTLQDKFDFLVAG